MELDKVQKEVNRSKTYLLPLFNNYIDLTTLIINNIYNTYIYCNNQPDYYYFYIAFQTEELSTGIMLNIDSHLIKSILYKETIVDDNITLYKFLFPKEHMNDYKLLLEGKFSKIQTNSKQKIILFLQRNFPREYQTSKLVKYTLFKSKILKETLEKSLNLILSKNAELGSKFNLKEETYQFSNTINNVKN